MTDAKQKEHVLVERNAGVMTVTLNRPEKKNALSHAMYTSIVQAFEDAEGDSATRALCVRGAAGCFTSGNDLKDFLTQPPTGADSPVMRLMHGLVDFKKPLIAVVEGPAVGIGTTMLLHCDMVYARDNATFQMPFTKLALCPEAGSSFLLPRVVGHTRAADLLLQGRTIDAATACQWGLVTEIFSGEDFDEAISSRLRQLAALPPEAVRTSKALLRDGSRQAIHDAINQEAQCFLQRLMSAEAGEAMRAFLEHRAPDFSAFS